MKKAAILTGTSILIIATALFIMRVTTNRPPDELVKKAGYMLKEAQLEQAQSFAKDALEEASTHYSAAMSEWNRQNERMILFRNFGRVTELSNKSIETSEYAISVSRQNRSGTAGILEARIVKAGDRLHEFDQKFGHFPLDKRLGSRLATTKLMYTESQHAYKNGNYQECASILDAAESVINEAFTHCNALLADYFKEYPAWNSMVKQTISGSLRLKNSAVIVDKYSRMLYVYQNGKISDTYTIELGTNWLGDKTQQGDRSTPEGMYQIVEKKQNGQTRYHKALLLNYPNEADRQRFFQNKKNGIVAPGASIGNLIEIHGHGGKGLDWTDGCIALTDNAMDELYDVCAVGTKVTIVGSAKRLNELQIVTK